MKCLAILILLLPFCGMAQELPEYDSLPTHLLSEITIQSSAEKDTLQNFFRANKSATTEDILNRMQGVYLIKRGSYGLEPMLQGMTAGQINVTIDGMKMFGACTDKMDPVTIYVEPQNLKAMSIKPGSSGSKMGSTVGGTIDMQLAQPSFSTKTFSGSAGIGYQGISKGANAYFNGNYSSKKSAYNISLNYRKAHNYKDGNGDIVPYSQYEKFNFSGGGKWSIGKDTLYANMLLDDGWNIGFSALPMDVGLAKARLYALTYQRVRCHGLVETFRVKGYYNSIYHQMDDTHRTDISMHMDMPGESKTTGMFVEGRLHRLKNHAVSFRSDFYYNKVLAEMTMYPENEAPMYMQTWPASGRAAAGLYLEDHYSLSTTTKIKADVRVDFTASTLDEGIGKDQLEVFYPEIQNTTSIITKSFHASIQQMAGNSFITELHAGYGERIPTLSETYGFYLFSRNDGYDYIGNVNLKAEKSWSGDLMFTYFTSSFQVSATGFYKYLPDYIFASAQADIRPMTPGANGVKVYHNIQSATFIGGDFNIIANLTHHFRLVNVTKYTLARDNTNTPLPLIPALTTITTLQYTLNQWNIQTECEGAFRQERVNSSFGEDVTQGYAILNLRSQYTFKKQNLSINGGIENILNTMYHNHLDWGNVPRPGRNFYISMSFAF